MREGSSVTPCVICKNPADWESPTGHWVCQTCHHDFPKVAEFRKQSDVHRIHQLRADAAAAIARLAPWPDNADEVDTRRRTAVLYGKLTRLTDAGKIRWDADKADWGKRPNFTRTDRSRPPAYTSDELLDKFEKVRRNGKGWTARCAAHEDKHPSLAITQGHKGWLIKCWTGCDFRDIVTAAGLDTRRMFYE